MIQEEMLTPVQLLNNNHNNIHVCENALACEANDTTTVNPTWSMNSWQRLPAQQQPMYTDINELGKQLRILSESPAIVEAEEIDELKQQLKRCETGDAFFVQMGDCAERFEESDAEFIELKIKAINAASRIFASVLGKDCIKIGRIAGQYAKPRSMEYETFPDGSTLPNYRGDNVNTLAQRYPNPALLTEGYNKSTSTFNLIRKLEQNIMARPFNFSKLLSHSNFASTTTSIESESIALSEDTQKNIENPHLNSSKIFTSHEGLLLNYESCFIRQIQGRYYNTSSHLQWIGERTRQIDGGHVELFRGISNPVAVKISSNTTTEALKALAKKLNPQNEMGKLIFICRFGNKNIEKGMPNLVKAKKESGINAIWCCDPMHGNTYSTSTNIKTRNLKDISDELQKFTNILRSQGENVGGIHLETSPIQVSECIGLDVNESTLPCCYTSSCDPRLNLSQSLYICNQFAYLLKPSS